MSGRIIFSMRPASSTDPRIPPGVCILIFAVLLCVTALALGIASLASFSSQRHYFCVELTDMNSTGFAGLQYQLDDHHITYRAAYHGTLGVVSSFQILEWTAPDTYTPILELCEDCATLSQATCINEGKPSDCQLLANDVDGGALVNDIRQHPLDFLFLMTLDGGAELRSHSTGSTCPFF